MIIYMYISNEGYTLQLKLMNLWHSPAGLQIMMWRHSEMEKLRLTSTSPLSDFLSALATTSATSEIDYWTNKMYLTISLICILNIYYQCSRTPVNMTTNWPDN